MDFAPQRLQDWLQPQKNIEGVLITKTENVFWLTGLKASLGWYLHKRNGDRFLITDGRYLETAEKICRKNQCHLIEYNADLTKDFGRKIEGKFLVEDTNTIAQYKKLKKIFPHAKLGAKNFIESLRQEKNEIEIKHIKKAQHHVDKILVPFMKSVAKPGITERTMAFRLVQAIRDEGRFDISFDPIVAFGVNSSIPHHSPSEKKLKNHENILIDCGAKYNGYCSDISRNFVLGRPDNQYRTKFEILKKAQESVVQKYRSGAFGADLDIFCRKALKGEPEYSHTLGHGVGLEIHENPRISQADTKTKLQKNEVVTCEPGLYYPGALGIRIEDLIVVRDTEPEILSRTPRDLIYLHSNSEDE